MTLNDDGPDKLEAVFLEACGLPSAEREAFLEKACVDDPELLAEVKTLLTHDDKPHEVFKQAPPEERTNAGHEEPHAGQAGETIPDRIGQYRILELLGEGSTAVVYLAEQDVVRRHVALKVLKVGLPTSSTRQRFLTEAYALGRIQHPGIAQVYEAGMSIAEAIAIPYVAMEYVSGARTIIDYAAAHHLGIRDRLTLCLSVCEAAHHGHEQGVLHCDLKPGNILVDSDGRTKIVDFGIARIIAPDGGAEALRAGTYRSLGTPPYMSPEQFDFSDLDARTDVYSLGAVLYELLCGSPPFEVAGLGLYEIARMIKEQTPRKPSLVNRAVNGGRESLLLKAMEKDRARRHQSVLELASEIEDVLQARRAESSLIGAADAVADPRSSEALRLQAEARQHRRPVEARRKKEKRERKRPIKGEFTIGFGTGVPGCEVRRFAGHTAEIHHVAFSPDGRHVLSCSADHTARLWDAVSGAEVHRLEAHETGGFGMQFGAFSPDGRYVLTCALPHDVPRIWDAASGREMGPFKGDGEEQTDSAVFSPDGRRVLSVQNESIVCLWDVKTRKKLRGFDVGGEVDDDLGAVEQAPLSPDGQYVLTCASMGNLRVQLWELATGRLVQTFPALNASVASFSPDGRAVITGEEPGGGREICAAQLWDIFTATELQRFDGHSDAVRCVAISPDGRHVLTGESNSLHLWDVASGAELWASTIEGMDEGSWRIPSVAFSPDGRYALSGSDDHVARLWYVG